MASEPNDSMEPPPIDGPPAIDAVTTPELATPMEAPPTDDAPVADDVATSEPVIATESAPTNDSSTIDAVVTSETAIATEPAQNDQEQTAHHDESAPATPVVHDEEPHEEEIEPYAGLSDMENTPVIPETPELFTTNREDSTEEDGNIEDFLDPEPESGPSATSSAPLMDIGGVLFQLPAGATVIDLDGINTPEPIDVDSVDYEPKIKDEIPDSDDDDVVMTGSITKAVDLEETTAPPEIPQTENAEEIIDDDISANSNIPKPTQAEKTVETSGEDQQRPKLFGIKKAFLLNRKDQDRGRMDKEQKERVTKAYEALQRKAARENADLPAYPSPQPVQAENNAENDADIVMDDTTESDTTPPPDASYIAEKNKLERRKKQKIATVEDDIELKRLNAKENLRLAQFRHRRDFRLSQRQEQDESLFIEQDTDGGALGDVNESSDENLGRIPKRPAADDEIAQEPSKRRKPVSGGRRANKIPVGELRDSMAVGIAPQLAKDKKKARKKTEKTAPKKGQKSAKDKETKKRVRTKKQPAMTNIQSLTIGNVIDAATANRNLPKQPGFSSKNKKNALAELIASIPEGEQKEAKSDGNALHAATKKFGGHSAMKADGKGGWILKGMKSSLYHYQLLGAAFMRDRENGGERPYGGFQADEMGFGKTVMMIANILDGRPGPNDTARTTLIVATAGLATQWLNEISKHVVPGALGEVVKYHAGTRIASADILQTLQRCDVIITTYNEVRASYPHAQAPLHLTTETQKNDWWAKHYHEKVGVLHKLFFQRIVLDEAQAIKNADSKTSIAVRGLSGKYRWAISGTPIQNTVEEFFPYFRFLKVKHTGDIETFRQNYVTKKDSIGMERLHTMLTKMMIRRTHLDQLFGRPLITLPDIERRTIQVEFNQVERHIYNLIKNRFCMRINAFSRTGSLDSNYRHIFAMMLCLRQLTGHIFLIQKVLKDVLQVEDIEALWVLTDAELEPESHGGTLKAIKKLIINAKTNRQPSPPGNSNSTKSKSKGPAKTPPDTPQEDDNDLGGGFGITFRFRKCLRSLYDSSKWDELTTRSLCHHCLQPPEEPMVTDCLHVYCKECLDVLAFEASLKDQDHAACKECGKIYEKVQPCKGMKELSFSGDPRTPRDREPSIDSTGKPRKAKDEDQDWLDLAGHTLPSAKTMAVKIQILQWMKESPDCKVIIFTQFLDMIRILTRICNNEGWGCCQFTGQMNFQSRDKSVEEFRNDPEKKVLLCSLKAGGIGLNLTMASKVIILDLYWNECVEQQAYCRAFRIGQEKEVEVVRFVVKNTIDSDMVAMQNRKTKEINMAIGGGGKGNRYTIPELMRLFGPVAQDEHGQAFILVEDEDEVSDVQDTTDLRDRLPPRPF